MPAIDILLSKQQWALALVLMVVAGLTVGQILFVLDRDKAFRLADWLDSRRKPFIKVVHRLLYQRKGTVKVIAFIFVVNLIGASLLHHTIGGLLIIPPFVILFTGGLLVSLVVRKYPERLLITAVVVPFEFGAFVVAATGGVSIGLTLWSGGEIMSSVREWFTLFSTLVAPLQFLNALLEGVLAYHLFIIRRKPWPQWLFDERV